MDPDCPRPVPRFLSREQLQQVYAADAAKHPEQFVRNLARTRLAALERCPVDTIREDFILHQANPL